MPSLPTGTVTFLFTNIEGSTTLLQRLGKLYHAYDRAKAEKHLTTAATMYREMGVGFWLAQAEAALKPPGPRAGR